MKRKNYSFLDYYNQYKHKIFNYFWYRVGFNRSIAEDLTSEVFLKAFKNYSNFDQDRSFQSWIYTISRNHLLNYYRTANREVELLTFENIGDNNLAKIENKIELQRIFSYIKQLPEYYREVLLLRFNEGLSNKEIAEVLEKNEGAIRTQISRAMDELRKNLN